MTRKKTTAKTTAVAKVPQSHGGALNTGGTPGNKGGGRPPADVRADLRTLLDESGRRLLEKAIRRAERDPESTDAGLRAVEIAARYGLGTKDEITSASPEIKVRLQKTAELGGTELPQMIREECGKRGISEQLLGDVPAIVAERFMGRLGEVWR